MVAQKSADPIWRHARGRAAVLKSDDSMANSSLPGENENTKDKGAQANGPVQVLVAVAWLNFLGVRTEYASAFEIDGVGHVQDCH